MDNLFLDIPQEALTKASSIAEIGFSVNNLPLNSHPGLRLRMTFPQKWDTCYRIAAVRLLVLGVVSKNKNPLPL